MKISSIQLTNFRRFANLLISDLPPAKLVILAGPNGSGKSTLFDAFAINHRAVGRWSVPWDKDYHSRTREAAWSNQVNIRFHGPDAGRKSYYIRSAYRNEAEFNLGSLTKQENATETLRISRMIDQDSSVSKNFQMLASNALEDAFERYDGSMSLSEFRDHSIGDIRDAVSRLFPDLQLDTLGNPLSDGTFRFTKGEIKGFSYKNLSGGEKAAFDLLLDLVVKSRVFDDTIFAIDEPETHLNTRLQGALLEELFGLVPSNCQLWIATHSIGMMRKALELYRLSPDDVIFLDFEGHNFDDLVHLQPVKPSRAFWQRILSVALDDLAELVAPETLIICEGNPVSPHSGKNAGHDAKCYGAIFEAEFPNCAFISGGNSHDVAGDRLKFASAFPNIIAGLNIRRLIDRDDHSPGDIADFRSSGVFVLSRRAIESYIYDDEIIEKLYADRGFPDRASAAIAKKGEFIKESIARGNASDDIKSAAPQIYSFIKSDLNLIGSGNDQSSFARAILVPLITPDTSTYHALRADIFADIAMIRSEDRSM